MKLKNVVLVLSAILFFTSISSNANAKDCSEYKKLSHKWIMCQAGRAGVNNVDPGESNLPKDEQAVESTGGSKLEGVKSSVGGFFKKIKNFGGENIGEEG